MPGRASDWRVTPAGAGDAPAIAELRNAAAGRLTELHGHGHWSTQATEAGILRSIVTSRVFVARAAGRPIGVLRLTTRNPWAIDSAAFTAVERPLYLLDMAVDPPLQRRGVGTLLIRAAARAGRAWPAQALRLDAYDAPAGAGDFYRKVGFREVGRSSYGGVSLVYFELLI